MSRRALGRGLKALIPESDASMGSARPVPVAQIEPNPNQPRRYFDEESLEELKASILTHGVVEPIIVRPVHGRYELVVGERRWRAAKMAGLAQIPAVVRALSDLESLELALIENIQREDLNPIEEAETYRRLMDEFGMTQEEVAERVGKRRSTVANSLRLLEIDPELREEVAKGRLSAGHAKALLSVASKAERLRMARMVMEEGLSVRATEALAAKAAKGAAGGKRKAGRVDDPEAAEVVERLQQSLGTKVRLVRQGDRGRIEIEYYSRDEMERIIELLGGGYQ